jgi:hypothetical protein
MSNANGFALALHQTIKEGYTEKGNRAIFRLVEKNYKYEKISLIFIFYLKYICCRDYYTYLHI